MKTARFVAGILFYLARIVATLVLVCVVYATVVVLLSLQSHSPALPIRIANGTFYIFYPFTNNVFLLGDYTTTYLASNLLIVAFYGLFLWLLSDVFDAFRQSKLFTAKALTQLSRFYITNLVVPVMFFTLLIVFGQELMDIVRISLLHLVIAVFTFFMAAIFKQGLLLQEEQDLTF